MREGKLFLAVKEGKTLMNQRKAGIAIKKFAQFPPTLDFLLTFLGHYCKKGLDKKIVDGFFFAEKSGRQSEFRLDYSSRLHFPI